LTNIGVNIVEKNNVDRITIVVIPKDGNPISNEIPGTELNDGRNYLTNVQQQLPPLSEIKSFTVTIDLFPTRSVFCNINIFLFT